MTFDGTRSAAAVSGIGIDPGTTLAGEGKRTYRREPDPRRPHPVSAARAADATARSAGLSAMGESLSGPSHERDGRKGCHASRKKPRQVRVRNGIENVPVSLSIFLIRMGAYLQKIHDSRSEFLAKAASAVTGTVGVALLAACSGGGSPMLPVSNSGKNPQNMKAATLSGYTTQSSQSGNLITTQLLVGSAVVATMTTDLDGGNAAVSMADGSYSNTIPLPSSANPGDVITVGTVTATVTDQSNIAFSNPDGSVANYQLQNPTSDSPTVYVGANLVNFGFASKSVNVNLNGSGSPGGPGHGGGPVMNAVPHTGVRTAGMTTAGMSWHCAWALTELAMAAAGLGLAAGALIGATGGIGAGAVVALVAAHIATMMALVDAAMACLAPQ